MSNTVVSACCTDLKLNQCLYAVSNARKTKTKQKHVVLHVQQNYTEKRVYSVIIVHETPPCCTHHIQDQRVYAATLTCEHPPPTTHPPLPTHPYHPSFRPFPSAGHKTWTRSVRATKLVFYDVINSIHEPVMLR